MRIEIANKLYPVRVKSQIVINRPYVPAPHPMQHRIDAYKAVLSLVTGGQK